MNNPATARLERGPTVKETVERWWRDRVSERLHARNEQRPPWDRDLFLKQFKADHPGDPRAVELAAAFEAALAAAHGNSARFADRFKLECRGLVR